MTLIDAGHRQMSRYIDLPKIRVLGVLAARGPTRPREISTELNMTKAAVSRHLTALERAGHITVKADPADARTFLTEPTRLGLAEIERITEAGTQVLARVIADWSDDDVATASQLIERLVQAWAHHGDRAHNEQTEAESDPKPHWRRARTETLGKGSTSR